MKDDLQKNLKNKALAANIGDKLINSRRKANREIFSDFENVEHRLEFVATIHGIDFINDSKATNVNSTWYALERMEKKVIWIVGGADEHSDFGCLRDLVIEKVRSIIYIGDNKDKVYDAFLNKVPMIVDAGSMVEAVHTAYYVADKGETILLSPASASFNWFDNYEERGEEFKKVVLNL